MIPIPLAASVIPWRLIGAAAAALGLAGAGFWGGLHWSAADVAKARSETLQVRADWSAERTAIADKTITESTRQHEDIDEIQRLAAASMAHRAAVARTVLVDSLRSAAVAFATGPSAGEDSATAGSCEGPIARAALLADMLGELEQRQNRVSIYADQLDLAGATCRAAYWAARGEAHDSAPGRLEPEGDRGDK